jgi:hypothetical protein
MPLAGAAPSVSLKPIDDVVEALPAKLPIWIRIYLFDTKETCKIAFEYCSLLSISTADN